MLLIRIKGADGKRFNIEIQISDESDYDKRALYYWAKLYTEQLKTAEDYASLSKAIGIHILNFTSIPQVTKYHNVFRVKEKETGLHYFNNLELHTIELSKFAGDKQGELKDFVDKAKNALDMWSTFLTRHDLLNKDHLPEKMNDPALKKALNVLEIMNFGEEERMAYEDRLKWFMIEANTLRKYKADGFVEGKAEGIAEGKKEEKGAIAKNLLSKGMDLEMISSVTGFSVEEIQTLK